MRAPNSKVTALMQASEPLMVPLLDRAANALNMWARPSFGLQRSPISGSGGFSHAHIAGISRISDCHPHADLDYFPARLLPDGLYSRSQTERGLASAERQPGRDGRDQGSVRTVCCRR